jgi:hypothetical protein
MFTLIEIDTPANTTDIFEAKSMILIISVVCSLYAVSRDHIYNQNAWSVTDPNVYHSIGLLIIPLLITSGFLLFALVTTTKIL